MLEGKVAVVFGAGGTIGSEVARVFGREGATVFCSARHLDPVEDVARSIRASGGKAEAAEVDALDEKTVGSYLQQVVRGSGKIDLVFNAIAPQLEVREEVMLASEISYESFLASLTSRAGAQFLTARAATRQMMQRGSGVVLFLSATTGPGGRPVHRGRLRGVRSRGGPDAVPGQGVGAGRDPSRLHPLCGHARDAEDSEGFGGHGFGGGRSE